MDFRALAEARYSVRAYRPDPVDETLLQKVLEAGILAPTACNLQPFRILVAATAGRETELRRVYRREWFVQGTYVIGIATVAGEGWVRKDGKNHAEIDAAIAFDHMTLAATDLGLGTCWIANFDTAAAREVFHLADGEVPMFFSPLGWPADPARPKLRRPMDQLVRRL